MLRAPGDLGPALKAVLGDELDAVTGALVGRLYLKGEAEVLGNFREGAIVIPRPATSR